MKDGAEPTPRTAPRLGLDGIRLGPELGAGAEGHAAPRHFGHRHRARCHRGASQRLLHPCVTHPNWGTPARGKSRRQLGAPSTPSPGGPSSQHSQSGGSCLPALPVRGTASPGRSAPGCRQSRCSSRLPRYSVLRARLTPLIEFQQPGTTGREQRRPRGAEVPRGARAAPGPPLPGGCPRLCPSGRRPKRPQAVNSGFQRSRSQHGRALG